MAPAMPWPNCERPPRDEYLLTNAGSAIGPVLRELRIWGETYAR
jgi:DNA-binding HxlR family transcriptional regulator